VRRAPAIGRHDAASGLPDVLEELRGGRRLDAGFDRRRALPFAQYGMYPHGTGVNRRPSLSWCNVSTGVLGVLYRATGAGSKPPRSGTSRPIGSM
jgi:hypothetical protein